MKKREYIALGIITTLSIVLILVFKFVPTMFNRTNNSLNGALNEQAKGEWLVVVYRGEIVQWFDSGVDATYTVKGNVGDLTIEVKDGKWHVSKVDCPNHNCEKMGWVDADSILPIQCIPNGIYIVSANAVQN